MIVGLVSDTHDCLPLIDEAVKRLNEMNVELVLHAGDYISPFVASHFKPLKAPLIGVFGNNDGDRELLKKTIEKAINSSCTAFILSVFAASVDYASNYPSSD